jgi:hypothetical protein
MATRAIDLRAGQLRDAAANARTAVVGWAEVNGPGERASFEDLFVAHYASFRDRCRAIEEPSVIVVAIDERRRRVDGLLALATRPDRLTSAIIGRHGGAHLFLEGDDALALRHLAVLAGPVQSWRPGSNEVSYRVLDLRSGSGFLHEDGGALLGVRGEGTAFFRCASYAFLFLAGGDPTDWPEAASDAWSLIPERVTFDERIARPASEAARSGAWPQGSVIAGGPPRAVERRGPEGHTTRVSVVHGPRQLDQAGAAKGAPIGVLDIDADGASVRATLDEAALKEGVLLGRYDRCDGATLFSDQQISRTHLLLAKIGGRVYAVDTASSNGSLLDGAPLGAAELQDGAELQIADATRLTWTRCV